MSNLARIADALERIATAVEARAPRQIMVTPPPPLTREEADALRNRLTEAYRGALVAPKMRG